MKTPRGQGGQGGGRPPPGRPPDTVNNSHRRTGSGSRVRGGSGPGPAGSDAAGSDAAGDLRSPCLGGEEFARLQLPGKHSPRCRLGATPCRGGGSSPELPRGATGLLPPPPGRLQGNRLARAGVHRQPCPRPPLPRRGRGLPSLGSRSLGACTGQKQQKSSCTTPSPPAVGAAETPAPLGTGCLGFGADCTAAQLWDPSEEGDLLPLGVSVCLTCKMGVIVIVTTSRGGCENYMNWMQKVTGREPARSKYYFPR